MASNNQAEADSKVFFRAPKGASAAIAMWKLVGSVVTLLAALFYGIGRFLADGFYTHLGTTASAAGVNTISIIEPAAVLGAFLAIFATAVLMLLDVLQRGFSWIRKHAGIIAALVVAAVFVAGAIWILVAYFERVKYVYFGTAIGIVLQIIWIFIRGFLVRVKEIIARVGVRVGARARARGRGEPVVESASDEAIRESAEAGPSEGAGLTPGAVSDPRTGPGTVPAPEAAADEAASGLWPRVTLVGVTAMIFIGLCIGAHYAGVHEANQAKKGLAVDISEAGLEISSISAMPVRLQPIDSSHSTESLSAYRCLLQIGSGASDLIFYDANKQETLSVPAGEVVVVSLGDSTRCAG